MQHKNNHTISIKSVIAFLILSLSIIGLITLTVYMIVEKTNLLHEPHSTISYEKHLELNDFSNDTVVDHVLISDGEVTIDLYQENRSSEANDAEVDDFADAVYVESSSNSSDDTFSTASSYILADSSTRYLTRSDISNLSSADLRIARNEIYARNGRRFNDETLQEYFNSKSWYTPLYSPEAFDINGNDILNDYEIKNLELISSIE